MYPPSRPLVALACCAVAVLGMGVATAAPKPVCNLVTDVAGDTNLHPVGGITSDALDITSVDIVTSKRLVTAVVRVKKLAATSTGAPTGQLWEANFVAEGVSFGLSAHTNAVGTPLYYASYVDPTTGGSIYSAPVTGVFDVAKSEIRMTTDVSTFSDEANLAPGKATLTGLGGLTSVEVLIPEPTGRFGNTLFSSGSPQSADVATSAKTYRTGTASCVTVGK